LAVRLGVVNVEHVIMKGLTAKQLLEWDAYARIEPFHEKWTDYRFASIVQALKNVFRGEDTKPVDLDDCLIVPKDPDAPKRPQTFQEQIALAKIMAEAAAKIHHERAGRSE
jgi:hypothetical protein